MIQLRSATLADAPQVALLSRQFLGETDAAAWKQRWETYPLRRHFDDIPIGWVLEDEQGGIRGAFANLHMLYDIGGRRVRAGIGCEWVVDPGCRGMSLLLLNAFLQQPAADLCLVGSASPVTAQILDRLKLPHIPAPDYDAPLIWALNPVKFAAAALRKRKPGWPTLLAPVAGLGLRLYDIARRSGSGLPSLTVIRNQSSFDEGFDELWPRLGSGAKCLRAIRSREVLDWRFEAAGRNLVVSERGGRLAGYAVLVRRQGADPGLNLSYVADLQAAGEDPAVFRDLLLGCLRRAAGEGADGLKFSTANPQKRSAALSLHPHSYRIPFWQMFYQANNPDLARLLEDPSSWDFSLFDTY
ncbi:MAG: hypothetical protein ACRD1C_11540 [Terriglobales bacterium]